MPAALVDRGGLNRGDLMLAQGLAHDLKPAGERAHSGRFARPRAGSATDGGDQRLFRVGELGLRLGEAAAMAPIESLDRCIGHPPSLRRSKLMAPDFERLARMPWPIASLASSGIRVLELGLGSSRARDGPPGCGENMPANSAQALEVLISTIRTASMRGRGGSTPNRGGGSPLSTQRQNFLSAVSRRCW